MRDAHAAGVAFVVNRNRAGDFQLIAGQRAVGIEVSPGTLAPVTTLLTIRSSGSGEPVVITAGEPTCVPGLTKRSSAYR